MRVSRPTDPLLPLRKEFPSLRNLTHFISHSLGAVPKQAQQRLREFTDLWATKSIEAWHDWLPMVTECGDRIGALIGAPKGTVVMHQNVSTLMSIIASSLSYRERPRVVLAEMGFPSVSYVWREQARFGARPHFVESRDGITVDPEQFMAAFDERTGVVVIELVLYRSGALQDAKALIRAAHKCGAIVIVDAYQAVGTVPVDVLDLDCDILMGGSVKWLCGGPGAAYLYVRKDRIRTFEPAMTGWFSHRSPFAFEPGRVKYRDDIMRYMGGTPSVPTLYSCRAGQEIIARAGVEAIRRKSIRQTTRLIEGARELGLTLRTPEEPSRRGGMVCLDFDGAEAAHHELLKRRFVVDHRPRCGIRISPHFYTKDDEIDAILDELRRLRSRGR